MITFTSKGMLTTVQDLGRTGYQRYGMPSAGAMDEHAMRLANILVGNPQDEAVLEATVIGPSIRFDEAEIFAITGGVFNASLNGAPIKKNRALLAPAGSVLSLGQFQKGARAYIAFAGGLDVPMAMGSRSTFIKANIGGIDGRAAKVGDTLKLKAPKTFLNNFEERFADKELDIYRSGKTVLRFTLGPQDDVFSEEGLNTILTSDYTVTAKNDRMGYRLEGNEIALVEGHNGNIISDGVCFGSIEVTNGQPIVMTVDRQTTGGYPKLGCVIRADLPLVAQLIDGDTVGFKCVDVIEAQKLYIEMLNSLNAFELKINRPESPLKRRYSMTVNGAKYAITVEETT